MSWLRATVVGAFIVAVTFVLGVVVPDLIVSRMTSFARGTRAELAAAWCAIAVVAILWALRRVQGRLLRSSAAA